MRRIARIDRSIDLLRTRTIVTTPNPYLCQSCKQRTTSFSTSALRAAKASEAPSFSEKLRRKIWGSDNPPGQKDPYGNASVFDQTNRRAKKVEKGEGKVAAAPDLGDYEPSDTWEGLEKVGGYGNWWRDNWDPEHQFKSFLPSHIMSDPAEITASLRRAMIEVFALRQAGKPLDGISKDEPSSDLTHDVLLQLTASGPTLDFGSQEAFEGIVQSLVQVVDETTVRENPTDSEQDIAADRSTVDPLHPSDTNSTTDTDSTTAEVNPTESEADVAADRSLEDPLHKSSAGSYDELVASWDQSWLQIPLDDPDVKFAVLKRTLQLTGIRLSDAQLKPATTAKSLLTHLITPPKPRKLVEALSQKEELMTLPNVSVYAKRVTPIDKHKAIGRWKLIENELEERGLPVTGRVV